MKYTYTFRLFRLEPKKHNGIMIDGFLENLDRNLIYENGIAKVDWCGDVCNYVQDKYGGGKYQLYVVDSAGKNFQTKVADLSGLPIIQYMKPAYVSPFTGKVV